MRKASAPAKGKLPLVSCMAACAAVYVAGLSGAGAAVIVQQVEADNSTATGLQYAPIDFAGNASVTVSGVTYWAMSGTTSSTLSGHAATVRSRLLSYAGTHVNTFYNQEANGYLNDKGLSYYTGGTNGYGLVPLPAATANGIRVVNHSWVGDLGSNSGNVRVTRTLDYLTARDDLVMVTAAVTSAGSSTTNSLPWSQRNGLAVRGTQAFNPNVTTADSLRKHADLWGPVTEEASYTTPQVSGIAAQIVDRAQSAGMSSATHHEVIKSILMTGADKKATDAYFTSWTPTLANNLDPQDGAGRANAQNSYDILADGQKTFTTLSSLNAGTSIVSPSVSSTTRGWSYLSTISELQSAAVVFHQSQSFAELTATLAWDVVPPTTKLPGNISVLDAGADQLANLDLRLYSVNYNSGTYTLGSALNLSGLSSMSADDNVEHLYYSGTLAAGYYAFVTTYQNTPSLSGYTPDAGFSYQFTSVPEPSAVMAAMVVGLLGLTRRQRVQCPPPLADHQQAHWG